MNITLVITFSIIILISIILSGFFSSADMVYSCVNRLRLKNDKSKVAKVALKFAENYDETITTILFSNNLVNILATTMGTLLGYQLFTSVPENNYFVPEALTALSETIMTATLLLLILIFGEILPKVIGRAYSYRLSKFFAYPLMGLKYLFFPIVFVTSKFGTLVAKPFFDKDENEVKNMSDDEIMEMVETIQEEGIINDDQEELIKSAIIFKDTEAHEIMTPRIDVYAIDIDDNLSKILLNEEIFKYTRIPVYKDSLDNVIGILPTKKLLRMMLAKEKITLKQFNNMLIEPVYVPFSMGISEILESMKKSKNHIVIVKDEYGSTAGLLTMEDILEELVGEIFDEMDKVEEPYKKIKKNQYEVSGEMNIDDFFALVDVDKPEDLDVTTIGGFLVDKLERFAKIGDKYKYENIRFEVLEISEFTVEKILVKVSKKKVEE